MLYVFVRSFYGGINDLLLFGSTVMQGLSWMTLLWAVAAGLLVSLLCILTSENDHPPPYYSYLCFMGFAVGMMWVFLIASEVVGLLQVGEAINCTHTHVLYMMCLKLKYSLPAIVGNRLDYWSQ
jgi:hypothetical protein